MRFVSAAFVFSVLFFPAWVSVVLGIMVATFPWGAALAILGGIVLDALFSAPIVALYGFEYVYTALFMCIALIAYVVRDRVVD